MKSLEAALAFVPSQLPASRAAIAELHQATTSGARTFDPAHMSELMRRIETAARSDDPESALAALAWRLVPRQLVAAVRSMGQWNDLRPEVATIARERPLSAYREPLWDLWQAHPGSTTVTQLLAEMGSRFGMKVVVGGRYESDCAEWLGTGEPVDALVRWTAKRRIGWDELPSIEESPFAADSPLVESVFRRTLQVGSAEQLLRMTNEDLLAGWRAMSGTGHMDACANFLNRLGPGHWLERGVVLEEIRDTYGLPEAEVSNAAFWNRVSSERRHEFREHFVVKGLARAFTGNSDRHRFWMEQVPDILDVQHGTAGFTDWSLIDFRGFSVVEFFEEGNAAYLYPADEPLLAQIRAGTFTRNPSQLKERRWYEGHWYDNRIIHRGSWQYSARATLASWKRTHGIESH